MNIDREYKRIENRQKSLVEELDSLPRGYLRSRKIGTSEYYYLQYREGTHIKSIYVMQKDVEEVREGIERRKKILSEWKTVSEQLRKLENLQGIHTSYKPVRDVDYEDYVLFMSALAHDFKRLGIDGFLQKYDTTKYRGIKKRYLKGFTDYVLGISRENSRKGNDLVLDPFTYQMYFKYGNKEILAEELKKAIPAFLNQGLLVTEIQEAVHGT